MASHCMTRLRLLDDSNAAGYGGGKFASRFRNLTGAVETIAVTPFTSRYQEVLVYVIPEYSRKHLPALSTIWA